MQKLKLQNKWNNETKSFERGIFELKETDKTISGKIQISSKQKDKYINKAIPFIMFKSQTDLHSQEAVKSGQTFEAEFGLGVNEFTDKEGKTVTYIQMIINAAKIEGREHYEAKANAYQPEQEEFVDDSIPF